MGCGLRPHPIYTPLPYWWMSFSVDSLIHAAYLSVALYYESVEKEESWEKARKPNNLLQG